MTSFHICGLNQLCFQIHNIYIWLGYKKNGSFKGKALFVLKYLYMGFAKFLNLFYDIFNNPMLHT